MQKERLTEALTKTLTRLSAESGLVGGVINVIRGGKVVYSYEYGYADRETKLPMGQDILFDVASTTKAWTVMLAAKAVDDGLLEWDAPIQKYIPEFTMLDAYAGANLSVRDAASHRCGLPAHDLLRDKISGDRENMMRKLAFLEPCAGFRSKYQYNNMMFILLGYLVERLRGMPWEKQIEEYIAKPLGIDVFRVQGVEQDNTGITFATPYRCDGYRAIPCAHMGTYASAPCGGLRISMKNMAKWIAAMSRGGVAEDGTRLCSEKQFREMIAPVISAQEEDYAWMKNCSYAMGWINGDYRGHNVIAHSGSHQGFHSQAGFLPEEDCGYVISFNTGSASAHLIARAVVLDALVDGAPKESYDDLIDNWCRGRDRAVARMKANQNGVPLPVESHSHLIGTFRHPAYETFEIRDEDGQLVFEYGKFRALLKQEPDGRITGYSDFLDGLTPIIITLIPQENGDIRLMHPDSADLQLLFVREN